MKRNLALAGLLSLAVTHSTTGCRAEQQAGAHEVTFDELFSSVEKCDKRHVILEGFYSIAFEIS